MTTQPESLNVPNEIRTVQNTIRTESLRTIQNLRHRDVFVIDSRPTR